ncbi:MAG: hypothetical protein HOK41_05100 [Nitrospina sp.]|jgi:hypothetical protein|nr:hypothetical protein [Nitrospina sp.]
MPVNVSTKIVMGFQDCLNNLSTQAFDVLKTSTNAGGLASSLPVKIKEQPNIDTLQQSRLNSQSFNGIQGFVANEAQNPQVVQGSILAEESSNLLLPSAGMESFTTAIEPIISGNSFNINGLAVDNYITQALEFWLNGEPGKKLQVAFDGLLLFTLSAVTSMAESFGQGLAEFSRLSVEISESLRLSGIILFKKFEEGMLDALEKLKELIKTFFKDFETEIIGIAEAKVITLEPTVQRQGGLNPFASVLNKSFFLSSLIGPSAGISSAPRIPSQPLNPGINIPGKERHIRPLQINNINQSGVDNFTGGREIEYFQVENIILNVPSDFNSRLTERQFSIQLRDEIIRLDRRISE